MAKVTAAKKAYKVVYNQPSRGLDPSPFATAVGSEALSAMVKSVEKRKCLDPRLTLYDNTTSAEIDGWKIRVLPKGRFLFKTFPGFVDSDTLRRYAAEHADEPSWYGNVAVAFAFAAGLWSGMVAFRVERDIRLLDYYDTNNIDRIVSALEAAGMSHHAQIVRIMSGTMSEEQQIRELLQMYDQKWKEIWKYNEVVPAVSMNVSRCAPARLRGLNPIAIVTRSYVSDLHTWPVLRRLLRPSGIEGYIRRNLVSTLEETGVMYQEEVVVSSGALGKLISEDVGHPVHWKNWRLTPIRDLPFAGVSLRMRIPKRPFTNPVQGPNDGFALLRYVLECRGALPHGTPVAGVLTYNVASFSPPDASLTKDDALRWLRSLAANCPRAQMVILQEVPTRDVTRVRRMLLRSGFSEFNSARNGGKTSAICVAARRRDAPDARFERVDAGPDRSQIAVNSPFGRVCAVHLEIGDRLLAGGRVETANRKIRSANAAVRIASLKEILRIKPDIILGDFNFTAGDKEDTYLKRQGYARATPSEPRTTPFNRVDHAYVAESAAHLVSGTLTIPSPVSDHAAVYVCIPQASEGKTGGRAPGRGGPGSRPRRRP